MKGGKMVSSEHEVASERKAFLDRFKLPGKVALVTGGSQGIGRAIAIGLAEAGADVVLASRKLPNLEAVAQEISAMGRRAVAVPANVRHLAEIDNLVKKTIEEFGRIDILVNNAGTNTVFGSVFDVDEKAWEVILGLNLKGYFFLAQQVGRVMREKGGGTIINVASQGGIEPAVGIGTYCISKAGVIMLTKVLAQEWGQYNIRVNTIAPALVKTQFAKALWDNPTISQAFTNNTALGRIAEPEEMVAVAVFLASEASSYITGQTVVLDGGHFASVRTLLSTIAPAE
jgi:dehydrogenase/reductase SDR family protein 4